MDLLLAYVQKLADGGASSFPTAKFALQHWTEFCEREDLVYASELTLSFQERYIAWRRERLRSRGYKGSNGTINRELGVLQASLWHGWRHQRLAAVPPVRMLPQPRARERFLTTDEVRRLLDACHDSYLYRFVLICLHTLQRPGAVFQLRVDQVDLARSRIDFLPVGAVQSNKRRPVVPITATLRPVLEACVAESRQGFVVERHGEPLYRVRRSFAKACSEAGLKGVTPYTLRHTGATLLAAAGVSMRAIAGMLGHTTEKTTESYAKHSPEFLKSAADALDLILGGSALTQERVSNRADTGQATQCAPVARQDLWATIGVQQPEITTSTQPRLEMLREAPTPNGVVVRFHHQSELAEPVPILAGAMVGAAGIEPATPTMSTNQDHLHIADSSRSGATDAPRRPSSTRTARHPRAT
ncbi:MAG: tyrosine-type recombinase/integrase [Phycisphaerales bacterium]